MPDSCQILEIDSQVDNLSVPKTQVVLIVSVSNRFKQRSRCTEMNGEEVFSRDLKPQLEPMCLLAEVVD